MNTLNLIKQGESQTVEQLLSGDYSSQTRNRAVAGAFKEAGIIEKYGSGIAKIQSECKKHRKVEASFEEFQHCFRIVLKKIGKNTNEGVNEGVKSLYELIKNNPNKKTPFFAKELNTSVKNIE